MFCQKGGKKREKLQRVEVFWKCIWSFGVDYFPEDKYKFPVRF